jgi:osmotically inducible lipoprotein OsmB
MLRTVGAGSSPSRFRFIHNVLCTNRRCLMGSSIAVRVVLVCLLALSVTACGRTPGTRAVTGGLLGAGGGAALGSATGLGAGTGALIGGGAGAIGGAATAR